MYASDLATASNASVSFSLTCNGTNAVDILLNVHSSVDGRYPKAKQAPTLKVNRLFKGFLNSLFRGCEAGPHIQGYEERVPTLCVCGNSLSGNVSSIFDFKTPLFIQSNQRFAQRYSIPFAY